MHKALLNKKNAKAIVKKMNQKQEKGNSQIGLCS